MLQGAISFPGIEFGIVDFFGILSVFLKSCTVIWFGF